MTSELPYGRLIYMERTDKRPFYREVDSLWKKNSNINPLEEYCDILQSMTVDDDWWFDSTLFLYRQNDEIHALFTNHHKPKRKRRRNYQKLWEQWEQTFSNVDFC